MYLALHKYWPYNAIVECSILLGYSKFVSSTLLLWWIQRNLTGCAFFFGAMICFKADCLPPVQGRGLRLTRADFLKKITPFPRLSRSGSSHKNLRCQAAGSRPPVV